MGHAAAHYCVVRDALECLQLLVQFGADPDVLVCLPDTFLNGDSPLLLAAKHGRPSCLQFLLDEECKRVDLFRVSRVQYIAKQTILMRSTQQGLLLGEGNALSISRALGYHDCEALLIQRLAFVYTPLPRKLCHLIASLAVGG